MKHFHEMTDEEYYDFWKDANEIKNMLNKTAIILKCPVDQVYIKTKALVKNIEKRNKEISKFIKDNKLD